MIVGPLQHKGDNYISIFHRILWAFESVMMR